MEGTLLPPPKRAREYISLIDVFNCDQTEKSKMKNVLGFVDKLQGFMEMLDQYNELGILSPLAHRSSAISETVKDSTSRLVLSTNTPLGRSFQLEPSQKITKLVELSKAVEIPKTERIPSWAESSEAVYKCILELRGCECCCFENCEVSSGFTILSVDFTQKIGTLRYGFCVICNSHQEKHSDKGTVELPVGTHVYFE